MIRFFNKKIFLVLFILAVNIMKAQDTPGGQPCFPGEPCNGRPTSPIDMYVYVLVIVAVVVIAFFSKKYKTQKL